MSALKNMDAGIQAYGYAVIAALSPMSIGDVIPEVNAGEEDEVVHPLRVIAESDRSEYERQCKAAGNPEFLHSAYQHFYRVVTD